MTKELHVLIEWQCLRPALCVRIFELYLPFQYQFLVSHWANPLLQLHYPIISYPLYFSVFFVCRAHYISLKQNQQVGLIPDSFDLRIR